MHLRRVVDLSRTIGPDTQPFPGDEPPELTCAATIADEGYNRLHVAVSSHTGTHVDAPYHFRDDGERIDRLPLDLFLGPAIVVDVTAHVDRQPVTWTEIAPQLDSLAPGTIVLLHTGWDRYHGTPRYFDHPYLSGDAAHHLMAAGIRTIGIDAPNPDETPDEAHPGAGWPVHHTVAAHGGVLIENLCGLHQIDFPTPLLSALPMKIDGGDGAPVRAVAMQSA
ncbi:cyclase family protein [Lipingzhangella sp. LS1_29]|uniref:Cyclase family protein n=1 Tax=Lipingzhangella rawalii TaxID=2055835 RepID=A0ABU2H8Z7_9ACTN|nr:cyclase family protein [Lipingzhangella rawalii]MDS1271310.1 cyclase family protein [Lipingzhangella rawalii]